MEAFSFFVSIFISGYVTGPNGTGGNCKHLETEDPCNAMVSGYAQSETERFP